MEAIISALPYSPTAAISAEPANGGAADSIGGLKRLQRRRSQLLLITGLVVVALLFGFLSVAMPTDRVETGLPQYLSLPVILYSGLALLIVLFLGYVGLAERSNHVVTLRLWEQGVRVESLRKRVSELQALQEVFTALNSRVHFRPTVELVLDLVFDITHARYASIMMATTVIQRSRGGFKPDEEFVGMVSTLAGRAEEAGKAVSVHQGSEYDIPGPQGERRIARYPLFSIPLSTGKGTIGALNVTPPPGADGFEEDTERLLCLFADQVATAIMKARLVQQLEGSLDELRDAQKRMVQAGKLAAVGELAAGVAHEINNPLGGILGLTQHMLERARMNEIEPAWMMKRLGVIEREANRAKEIVRDLLNFSRSSSAAFDTVDLLDVLRGTLGMLEHQLSLGNIAIEKKLQDSLPAVIGNANQLQQVFTNILVNAEKAIGTDGTITIVAETRKEEGCEMVRLAFSDTGCGIPAHRLDRIFEPFFTTSEIGKGTGLGLSVSYRIIKDHHGEIFVEESAPGKGTTFTILLPMSTQEGAVAAAACAEKNEEER